MYRNYGPLLALDSLANSNPRVSIEHPSRPRSCQRTATPTLNPTYPENFHRSESPGTLSTIPKTPRAPKLRGHLYRCYICNRSRGVSSMVRVDYEVEEVARDSKSLFLSVVRDRFNIREDTGKIDDQFRYSSRII